MSISESAMRGARWSVLGLVMVPLLATAQFRGGGGAMMARGSITDANRASQMAMDRGRQSAEARNARVDRAQGSRDAAERNASRESSRSVNREVSRDVNIDVDDDKWGDGDIDHPIAAGAAMGAAMATTAAIVGSYYTSVPAGCPVVNTYAVPYYHCNGVYYEQRMQGDEVVYVVVNP